MLILRLAIPSPLRRLFDYLPPEQTQIADLRALRPGCRVRVPFGRRELIGILIEVVTDTEIDPKKLKAAIAILDEQSLISPAIIQLCSWGAGYYHHPPGEVFSTAFPADLRKGKPHRELGAAGWQLNTRGKGLPGSALQRSPKQALALSLLQESPQLSAKALQDAGASSSILRALLDRGLVEKCLIKSSPSRAVNRPGLEPNPEQARAIEAIGPALGEFSCHLVEGVTGSGKTEVYLQLIALCLQQDRQALVLIPEIGLTPQTLTRFQDRFEANIVSLHSGMADGERFAAWEAARDGSAHIMIGTRSSVFTSFNNLGLIIVDEEHDNSFKQQDGFRYSARDLAVKRGQLENCPVVLGSATPSLESIHNASTGRYHHHVLEQRAAGAQMPSLQAIDIRKQVLSAGFSPELVSTIGNTLQAQRQVLLFLNRRGFAPTLLCHDCGWLGQCGSCDARLTVHRREDRLRCHHCGHAKPLPRRCPECHSNRLMTAGVGTEQAEVFLRGQFPQYPLHRVDSDSMRTKHAMASLVTEMATGTPCILLGTQMLTKGHHFPAVGLVAVIDADAALFSADFRGEERMAQLLTQVAGRAGRATDPGTVLLQTHYPDHPAIRAILEQPYGEHARRLLAERLALGLPPGSSMALIRTDADTVEAGDNFLLALRAQLNGKLPPGATLIGPIPSPMQRRARKYRSQLILNANNRAAAQQASSAIVLAASALKSRGVNWTVDIDPQDSF
jgi:primosomal protein N' (replication factor Y) (superfamily II helicase)